MMTILDALVKEFEKQMAAEESPSSFELRSLDGSAKINGLSSSMSQLGMSSQSQVNLVGSSSTGDLHFKGIAMGSSNNLTASNLAISTEATSIQMESAKVRKPRGIKSIKGLKKMLGLSVCYSASCGGIGTLTGTPTNLILVGQLQTSFNQTGLVNFASWIICAMPLSFIMIIAAWIWLQVCFLGPQSVWNELVGGFTSIIRLLLCRRQVTNLFPLLSLFS